MAEVIGFGQAGEDDRAVRAEVLDRLAGSGGHVMLDDGDDADPAEAPEGFRRVAGDRLVWAGDEEATEAIAVVAEGRARDWTALRAVAAEWTGDDPGSIEILRFGAAGEDDLLVDPVVLERLPYEGGFVMLEPGDDDPAGRPWPAVPGDRVVWAVDEREEEAEPVAVVAAERAADPLVLERIADLWAEDAGPEVKAIVVDSGRPAPAEAATAVAGAGSAPEATAGARLTLIEEQAARIEALEREVAALREALRDRGCCQDRPPA